MLSPTHPHRRPSWGPRPSRRPGRTPVLLGCAVVGLVVLAATSMSSTPRTGQATLAPTGMTLLTLVVGVWAIGLITLGAVFLSRAWNRRKP